MRLLKLVVFILFLAVSAKSNAQNIRVSNIGYKFLIPNTNDKNRQIHYQNLVSRIKSANLNGITFSNQASFVVVPNITIIQKYDAGEIEKKLMYKIEINLHVREIENNIDFHNFRKVYIELGNINEAIAKAINKVNASDPLIKAFFNDTELAIVKFYNTNCDNIVNSAKTNVERKEYNKAYNKLKYIPENTNCYQSTKALINKIYFYNKEESCAKLLAKAKILESKNNNEGALDMLKYIDPSAGCYSSVSNLVQKISLKVNKDKYIQFESEKLKFKSLSENEKIKALSEILKLIADGI